MEVGAYIVPYASSRRWPVRPSSCATPLVTPSTVDGVILDAVRLDLREVRSRLSCDGGRATGRKAAMVVVIRSVRRSRVRPW